MPHWPKLAPEAEPRSDTDHVARHRVLDYGRTLNVAVLCRKHKIGTRAVDYVGRIGAIASLIEIVRSSIAGERSELGCGNLIGPEGDVYRVQLNMAGSDQPDGDTKKPNTEGDDNE